MAVKLMRDNPADELRTRIGRLHKLLQRIVPAPDEWREAAAKNRDRIEPLACSSWEVCEAAWQDCLRWRQSLSDTLSVMLAVAASTSQTGNQLFLQVIAAAGSAKTQLCDAMLVSQNCFGLEHLTGFHSGVVSDDGRDLSLLSRINHKTLITPEGDVLVASPMFQELMSQVRRIFDGKSGAVYKNTDEDKKWEGLRTPWILAGTPAMIDYWDQSRLGDRFLRVIVDTPVQDERRKIVLAAMNSEWEAVAERSSEASGGVESKMRRAYALTGGFVDWLRENCFRIDEVTASEDVVHRIADFAEFTADMRAKPNLDTRKLETHDSKEVPTRIGRQLIRLARCLALVMGKREVDADVMRRVRKVALDSAGGKTLDLLKWMHAVDPRSGKTYQESGGIMASQLARWASFESESKCLAYLNFLLKIDVMEHVPCQHSHGHWRMTPRVESLQKSLR